MAIAYYDPDSRVPMYDDGEGGFTPVNPDQYRAGNGRVIYGYESTEDGQNPLYGDPYGPEVNEFLNRIGGPQALAQAGFTEAQFRADPWNVGGKTWTALTGEGGGLGLFDSIVQAATSPAGMMLLGGGLAAAGGFSGLGSLFGGDAAAAGVGSAAGGGAAEIASLADLAGFGGVGELGAGLGATAGGGLAELPFPSNLPGTNSPVLPTVPGGTGTIINGVPPVGNIASALNGLGQLPPTPNLPGTNSPTLPTVPGTTGTIIDGVPPVGAAAGVAGAASGASGGLSQVLKDTFGLDIGADALKTLGTLGGTALGVFGSMNQTKTLKDLADREFGVRQPFIDLAKNAAQNPDSWYNSAPAMGATDAVLRKLSVNGNPALNPGDLSKAAAYNLGGYSDYLGKVGGLALGSAPASISLGKDIAGSEGNTLNALGAGLADLTNPRQDWTKILAQMQRGNWLA